MLTSLANHSEVEVASRLRLAVTRLARRLRQESAEGLSPSMTSALATIDRLGPLSPSAFAEAERIQRPSATRILTRLEESGLITRVTDAADGRARRVATSADGRALLRRLRKRKTAFLSTRLRGLDQEELATLDRAAGILERVLEDRK